jgi:hypothetical protein
MATRVLRNNSYAAAKIISDLGRLRLRRKTLQCICIDFYSRMLIDQVKGEDEPQAAALSDKNPLNTLHHTSLDAHLLADDKFPIRLGLPAVEA